MNIRQKSYDGNGFGCEVKTIERSTPGAYLVRADCEHGDTGTKYNDVVKFEISDS